MQELVKSLSLFDSYANFNVILPTISTAWRHHGSASSFISLSTANLPSSSAAGCGKNRRPEPFLVSSCYASSTPPLPICRQSVSRASTSCAAFATLLGDQSLSPPSPPALAAFTWKLLTFNTPFVALHLMHLREHHLCNHVSMATGSAAREYVWHGLY